VVLPELAKVSTLPLKSARLPPVGPFMKYQSAQGEMVCGWSTLDSVAPGYNPRAILARAARGVHSQWECHRWFGGRSVWYRVHSYHPPQSGFVRGSPLVST